MTDKLYTALCTVLFWLFVLVIGVRHPCLIASFLLLCAIAVLFKNDRA